MRSRTALCLSALLLVTIGWSAKQAFDFDDTTWASDAMTVKASGSAKGLGKLKVPLTESGHVDLLPGNAWQLVVDGEVFAKGTYTRKNEFSTKLTMSMDAEGTNDLEQESESLFDALASQVSGVDIDTHLEATKFKLGMSIKVNKKTQMAHAVIKGSAKFAGLTDGEDEDGNFVGDAKTKASLSFSATSNELPLAAILPGT